MADAEVNGITIHYEDQGEGPALVLMHGLGGSTEVWKQVAAEFRREFRVVSIDLRGSGRSDKPAGPYSLELLLEDLAGLSAALGLAPMTLVGHSLSGILALAYAARHAPDVTAVVGVGTVANPSEEARALMRERAERARDGGMSDVARGVAERGSDPTWRSRDALAFATFREAVAAHDPEAYASLALLVAGLDVSAELSQVTIPVLLVAGETDIVCPPESVRATVERLPNATYASMNETGHLLPLERPLELARLFGPFVRSHAGLEVDS